MLASIAKAVEFNAAAIKDCKTQLQTMDWEMLTLKKDNAELMEWNLELEWYKRWRNLRILGIKEIEDEHTWFGSLNRQTWRKLNKACYRPNHLENTPRRTVEDYFHSTSSRIPQSAGNLGLASSKIPARLTASSTVAKDTTSKSNGERITSRGHTRYIDKSLHD